MLLKYAYNNVIEVSVESLEEGKQYPSASDPRDHIRRPSPMSELHGRHNRGREATIGLQIRSAALQHLYQQV